MLDAVRIFDARSGKELRWFAGPAGRLAFDNYLFSFGETIGTSVWDVTSGERLLADEGTRPLRYHPCARVFLSMGDVGFTLSRLVGEVT